MNKKDPIFIFFIIAILMHLSLFFVHRKGIKGENSIPMKTHMAPISVRIKPKSNVSTPTKPPTSAPKPAPKKSEPEVVKTPPKVEPKKIVESKIKTKEKIKKQEVKKEKIKSETKTTKENKVQENNSKVDNTKINDSNESSNSNSDFFSGNFTIGKDGSFVAASSDGIDYNIIKQVEPDYPVQAERIRYRKKVVVSVRFLVGLKGEIENIEFLTSHKKLGFDDEVKKALNQWKFQPIYYKGKNIKVYFTKEFIFNPK